MTDDDPFASEEWLEYAEHVKEELIPKLEGSAVAMMVVSENKVDVQFAVQLGFSIMMDKPLIAVVTPGSKVPDKLAKVADRIVEARMDDPRAMSEAIAAAFREVVPGLLGKDEP